MVIAITTLKAVIITAVIEIVKKTETMMITNDTHHDHGSANDKGNYSDSDRDVTATVVVKNDR